MANISNLTLKKLITDRPDLVNSILAGEHEGTTKCFTEKDSKGRMKKWTEEYRDLDGKLISKRVDDYTYAENSDIDIISMKRYDDKENEISEEIISHQKNKKDKDNV